MHLSRNLLSMSIHYTKFGNFQAKGSFYIKRTSLVLQTDRQLDKCKQHDLFFSKGWGHRYWSMCLNNDKQFLKIPHLTRTRNSDPR